MGAIGGLEWLVVVFVVLLLFGAKKIPELARGVGQGIHEFRKASSEIRMEIEKGSREATRALKSQTKTEHDSGEHI
ncbi:MAG: twin-arginine translocase TatA/TatE family subunit [Balneolales bacterium]